MSLNDNPQWDLWDDFHDNYEHSLYQSVVDEITEIGGFPIYYWIHNNTKTTDYLYGEDPNVEYIGPYKTRVLYEITEEEEVLNSFGLSSNDTLNIVQLSKEKFKRDIAEEFGDSEYNPKPSDAIKLLWNNKTYSISDVNSENNVFLGRKMMWDLICRPFSFSEESSSAEDILYSEPPSGYFDEDNTLTTTEPLSAYGENEEIEEESFKNPDSAIYGYS